MNAVEIEEAVSKLAELPFDSVNFPFAFLEAFGNKPTTIQRLRAGSSNKSDIEGGILQHNNIHMIVCGLGKANESLEQLRKSSATTKHKVKFILVTDGRDFQSEDLATGETVACEYKDFPNHFGFFLPLAGISTVQQIRESSFDIKATGRLNRLYVELIKDNPTWGAAERRHDMNHFMARLIFCFFAEDTDIFKGEGLFSRTIEKMSARDSSNTHEVIAEIFRAMNTDFDNRTKAKLPRWVEDFPYVNGGLFSGNTEVPHFSKIARSYLLHVGSLEWKKINPDIFGSMIQAVTEDEERGALGMHYTSVPNILRVLNPLFLDELRSQLEKAGENSRALLNLRKRISKIRVFDPACGSGNFLVIAYKELRSIEAEINKRRGEPDSRTEIQLTHFHGIELRDFPAEIARLALIIAEYQCNVLYIGQTQALKEFLPLDADNWIVNGNALRLNWNEICPVIENLNDGEVYLCGNPPYLGSTWQSDEQKEDLKLIFDGRVKNWKSLDYVAGWFIKGADYCASSNAKCAFVATNSICQGQQVPILWPLVFSTGNSIFFAHTSFKWANLASYNAGVSVVIVGISTANTNTRKLYTVDDEGNETCKLVENINAYLISGPNIIVDKSSKPLNLLPAMSFGNKPVDGGNLLLSDADVSSLHLTEYQRNKFIKRIYGSAEFIQGKSRYCLWIEDRELQNALSIPTIRMRIEAVQSMRLASKDKSANQLANRAHQFREMNRGLSNTIVIPSVSSESRPFLPVGIIDESSALTNLAFGLYDEPIWNLAIIASKLHLVWVKTICGQLETRLRYSNTLGWNTFPVPLLTEKNKTDLTRCAEDILLAREAHFPATIADLYDPGSMPENLRHAHDRNDEVLERIYIGRRFKNDSERLEKLFELYTKMVAVKNAESAAKPKRKGKKKEARA